MKLELDEPVVDTVVEVLGLTELVWLDDPLWLCVDEAELVPVVEAVTLGLDVSVVREVVEGL